GTVDVRGMLGSDALVGRRPMARHRWAVLATATTMTAIAGTAVAPAGQAQGPGLRYCERPGPAGNFLAVSPGVSCRTARRVRRREHHAVVANSTLGPRPPGVSPRLADRRGPESACHWLFRASPS